MARKYFSPKGDRFGVVPAFVAGGNAGPISPVATGSATVIYRMQTPLRKAFVERIGFLIGTLAIGSAAITIQFFVRNSVGSKSVALTAATDIKTGTTLTKRAIALTATDFQRYLEEGDYLAFDIVCAGTVTTQPADILVDAELCILE